MPQYATFEPEYPLAEGYQRLGLPMLVEPGGEIDSVVVADLYEWLGRRVLEGFESGAGDLKGKHYEVFECQGNCDSDYTHPHKFIYAFMDVHVEKLREDLEVFCRRKLSSFGTVSLKLELHAGLPE